MSYNLNKLTEVGDLIEKLSVAIDASSDDIIEALVGMGFDEEESMQVRHYLSGCPPEDAP